MLRLHGTWKYFDRRQKAKKFAEAAKQRNLEWVGPQYYYCEFYSDKKHITHLNIKPASMKVKEIEKTIEILQKYLKIAKKYDIGCRDDV